MITAPKTQAEALTLAIYLKLTAPDKARAKLAADMVQSLSVRLTYEQIQQCTAKAVSEANGS